jgi:branched-chain amino acid transport system substrate-binding protein
MITRIEENKGQTLSATLHRLGRIALLFLIVSALLSISSIPVRLGHADAGPILIGEVDPLTGKLAKHGQEIHEGILYAVEEINAAGGIGGRTFELASRDDQSLPEVAINQTEDLLYRAKVVGLVGGYVDSLVGPISELAAKHRTPYVASASLQRNLTRGRHNPYFFRVSNLGGIVEPLCGFVKDVLRPKRAAVLYSATPGSTEFGTEVEACLQGASIAIPVFEKFRQGSPDFSAFLLKVRQMGAEVLVSGGFFPDHLILARQLKQQHVPLKAYLGPWGVAYPSFIEEVGEASEHLFGMCAWSPGITLPGTEKESEAFVEGFSKRFGKLPNTTTMHGYTSARALIEAIGNALDKGAALTGESIVAELRSLDMKLPMEHLKFDENGDPEHYRQVVVQIQKGRLVAVHPPDQATGKVE